MTFSQMKEELTLSGKSSVYVSAVEEMILNPDALHCNWHPKAMDGWRRYRLEYGFECSCPEGTIYLPPDVDVRELEDWIDKKIQGWVPNA